jgi:hypothetical protein
LSDDAKELRIKVWNEMFELTNPEELAKKTDRLEKIEKAATAFCSKTLGNSLAYWKYDREYLYLEAALDGNTSVTKKENHSIRLS